MIVDVVCDRVGFLLEFTDYYLFRSYFHDHLVYLNFDYQIDVIHCVDIILGAFSLSYIVHAVSRCYSWFAILLTILRNIETRSINKSGFHWFEYWISFWRVNYLDFDIIYILPFTCWILLIIFFFLFRYVLRAIYEKSFNGWWQ